MSFGLLAAVLAIVVTSCSGPCWERGGVQAPSRPCYFFAKICNAYYFPSFGGFGAYGFYGGYYSPFIDPAPHSSTQPYLPKHWWVERYPSADPRQSGYNPNSGYAREEVTTLLLSAYPVKARVILDGLFVGTSDSLGPMQLPLGMHTLRLEAAGLNPQTLLNVERHAATRCG
jgi:hypothetical protein